MSVDRADLGRGDPAGMLAASRERASKAATVRAAQVEMRRAAAEADREARRREGRETRDTPGMPLGFARSRGTA